MVCLLRALIACSALGHCFALASTSNSSLNIVLVTWRFSEFCTHIHILSLLTLVICLQLVHPKIPFISSSIPQSIIFTLLGVAHGSVLEYVLDIRLGDTIWLLTSNLFFYALLPPIILDASYNLYRRSFLHYFCSILVHAVVGTVLNFLIIGPLMYGLQEIGAMGQLSTRFSINSYFLFAALIVAVDPVAVLSIFNDVGVNVGLYYTVFGESLFNDAVTMVLYRIMSEFVNVTKISLADFVLVIGCFFTISSGGLLLGCVFGILTCLITRFSDDHFHHALLIILAYASYIMAEALEWSGIIAMIACGLIQVAYAFQNLTRTGRTIVREMVKQLAQINEAVTFYFVGIQLFSAEIRWNIGFCLWGLVACILSRFIVIISLSFVINRLRTNSMRMSFREQMILIYGGLRGAVSFSLALLVKASTERSTFVTATLFIILVTTVIVGLTMKPLVRLFHVQKSTEVRLSMFLDMFHPVVEHTLAGIETIVGAKGRNRMQEWLISLDDRFIRRFLQRQTQRHDEKVVQTYEKIALRLHHASLQPSESLAQLKDILPTLINLHRINNFVNLKHGNENIIQEVIRKDNISQHVEHDLS